MLQASGSLKDLESKLNLTVSKVARCQNISVVAYYEPGRWYLTPGGARHPLQVRVLCTLPLLGALLGPWGYRGWGCAVRPLRPRLGALRPILQLAWLLSVRFGYMP